LVRLEKYQEPVSRWLIDTDYNEESFFVRHVYFLRANDPYESLKIIGKHPKRGSGMRTLESTLLEEREKEAIEEAVVVLKERLELQAAVLFGSKARGDDDRYSDLDLLLITGQPLHWKEEKAVVGLLFEIGIKHGVIFSPLFVSSEEWNGGQFTEFPVYKEIIRDGAMIA